jgi:RHS repeat-associated protein
MEEVMNIFVPRQKICISLVAILSSLAGLVISGEPNQAAKSQTELAWKMEYDDEGQIIKAIDPGGKEIKFDYEFNEKKQIRRLSQEFSDGSKVSFEFDDFGRRAVMNDDAGQVHYTYDEFNRLKSVGRVGGAAISYTYDSIDRLSSMSLGEDLTVSYSYDFLGRLSKLTTPAGDVTYDYRNGDGVVIRTLPNGIRTIWSHSPDGRLESITHVKPDDSIIAEYKYSHRTDGLITSINEWTSHGERALQYEYDTMQRLSAAVDSKNGGEAYNYDQFGNRLEMKEPDQQTIPSSYDWAGRMMYYNGQQCLYDPSGNLLSDGMRSFEYTRINLLKKVWVNNHEVACQYDGDSYLIERTVDGNKSTIIPDPLSRSWRPLIIIEASGKPIVYIWQGEVPLMVIDAGVANFFMQDHLGSVRGVLNSKGEVISLMDYKPFGAPLWTPSKNSLVPGFAGMIYDPISRTYITPTRSYDPEFGRFLQPLPQVGFSNYDYCEEDPVNFINSNGGAIKQQPQSVNDNFYDLPLWYTAFGDVHQLYMSLSDEAFARRNNLAGFGWLWIDRVGFLSWGYFQNVLKDIGKTLDQSQEVSKRISAAGGILMELG